MVLGDVSDFACVIGICYSVDLEFLDIIENIKINTVWFCESKICLPTNKSLGSLDVGYIFLGYVILYDI